MSTNTHLRLIILYAHRAGAGPGAVVQVDICSRRRARRGRSVAERHSKRCRAATNHHGPARPDVEEAALDAPAKNAADARVKEPQCMICRNDHEARTRCYEAHLFSFRHFREPRGLKPDLRPNAIARRKLWITRENGCLEHDYASRRARATLLAR